MIRTWKCLLGAWAVCAIVCRTGYSQVVEIDELGVARVQQPATAPRPADVLYSDAEPVWLNDFQPPPGVGVDPVTIPEDNSVGYAVTNDVDQILYRIQRINGHYMGLNNTGYTSAGAFVPLESFDGGNGLIAIDPRAYVDDTARGGLNLGLTFRRFSPSLQRVFVLSNWLDYDSTGKTDYAQYGLHGAILGKFWSLRGNINLPIGQSHTIYNTTFTGLAYQGNFLYLTNNAKLETAYQRFDAEWSMPIPYFARFGWEFGLGGYFLNSAFNGNTGVRDALGVSTRFQAQVTEDIWANALLTKDNVFGNNLSINFEVTIPNGAPSRMFRRLPIKQYMVQSDLRTYRVLRKVYARPDRIQAISTSPDYAGNPIKIVYVNPNVTTAGDGTVEHPFQTLAQYTSLADPVQSSYEIIYVMGNTNGSDTGLNTTLDLFNGQRLLGDGTTHTITTVQGTFVLPGFGTPTPFLTNSADTTLDVVRLANRNEVSGFKIDASSTAVGINGLNGVAGISGFNINHNTIQNTTIGANLNVTGTDDGFLNNNTVTGATGNGVVIGVSGGNFSMPNGIVSNTITGNGANGLVISNLLGGTMNVSGIAANDFSNNTAAGVLVDGEGSLAAIPMTLNLGNVTGNNFTRSTAGTIGFGFDAENVTVTGTFATNNFTADHTANANASFGLGGRLGGTGGANFTFGPTTNIWSGNGDAHIGLILDDDTTSTINITGEVFNNAVAGSNTQFNGEGVAILVRQRASLSGSVKGSTFEGNAGGGLKLSVNGNSFPAFARITAFTIGGPNVADGNTFRNNNGDGLAIIRTGNGQVGSTSTVLIQNNLFESNNFNAAIAESGNGFRLDTGGTTLFQDRYNVLNNRSINNEGSGALLYVRADARMNVDMDQNLFDGNTLDGITLNEQTNSAGDQRALDGTWTRNQISNNLRDGIGLHGDTSGLTIGDLLDDNLANLISHNAQDGINITGPGSVTIARNLIQQNGRTNATTFALGVDNDAGINIHSATFWNGVIFHNDIINNNGDGIQMLSDGPFPVFADINENFVAFNGGRGFDLLARPSNSTHDSFTDIDFHDNVINENGEEGVYIVLTASHDQTQNGPSAQLDPVTGLFVPIAMNANGHVNVFTDSPQLRFDMTGNQILGNGRLSNMTATGLVVRVGTTGEGSLFGAPFQTSDFVSDGVSVDSAFQNSGVIMRVADNQFGGNFGDDVFFDSFTSTEVPVDTQGTWSTTEFTITRAVGDPLARLDLHWSNNTFDSTDVNNVGAFYENPETTFKSRDINGTPPGPFPDGPAQPRRRNAQRLAARLPNVLAPTSPVSAPFWLYPGMGPSSFRVQGSTSDLTGAGFFLDNSPYNDTGDASGVFYPGILQHQMPYGWGRLP